LDPGSMEFEDPDLESGSESWGKKKKKIKKKYSFFYKFFLILILRNTVFFTFNLILKIFEITGTVYNMIFLGY
jgi:hypothetical protein